MMSVIATDTRTFAQMIDDAYKAAVIHAAPFVPSRAEVEDRLKSVVDALELMDDPKAFVSASVRAGHWDSVAIEMFRSRVAGGRR